MFDTRTSCMASWDAGPISVHHPSKATVIRYPRRFIGERTYRQPSAPSARGQTQAARCRYLPGGLYDMLP